MRCWRWERDSIDFSDKNIPKNQFKTHIFNEWLRSIWKFNITTQPIKLTRQISTTSYWHCKTEPSEIVYLLSKTLYHQLRYSLHKLWLVLMVCQHWTIWLWFSTSGKSFNLKMSAIALLKMDLIANRSKWWVETHWSGHFYASSKMTLFVCHFNFSWSTLRNVAIRFIILTLHIFAQKRYESLIFRPNNRIECEVRTLTTCAICYKANAKRKYVKRIVKH